MAKWFTIGRPVLVRFGTDWLPGVVLDRRHDTISVDTARGLVYVHSSVLRRDLRVA